MAIKKKVKKAAKKEESKSAEPKTVVRVTEFVGSRGKAFPMFGVYKEEDAVEIDKRIKAKESTNDIYALASVGKRKAQLFLKHLEEFRKFAESED